MGSYILCPFSPAILFWEMCIIEVYICEKETFNILLTIKKQAWFNIFVWIYRPI